ncbi:hypothetical protein ACFY8N_05670 [Streptomyces collinus]|uniref:hypothetical protein n=1 Tax=Streptomyces collinus TaxID=42684 RepID=UPI0036B19DEA
MLRVEVEIFSGRPNPTWVIHDEDAARTVIETVAKSAEVSIGIPGQGYDGLGYREILISPTGDSEQYWQDNVPHAFALGTIGARDPAQSIDVALRVVEDMTRYTAIQLPEHAITPITESLKAFIVERITLFSRRLPSWFRPMHPPQPQPHRTTIADRLCDDCEYETDQFNPDFWNHSGVQAYNNCYNYATNLQTNSFAQPGRAEGFKIEDMTCADITQAALADGLRRYCDCLDSSEYPRQHMALTVWPGIDYHWYREQRGGIWGHKPGKTEARKYDNKGNIVTDPETCDRGDYADFCGYFYAGRSVVIN